MNKIRIKNIIILNAILIALGIVYFLWIALISDIPCLFNAITSLKCAGCGITRMIQSLFKFDIYEAFRYNAFVFMSLPFLGLGYFYSLLIYYKLGKIEHRFNLFFYGGYGILLIIWMILRNFLHI